MQPLHPPGFARTLAARETLMQECQQLVDQKDYLKALKILEPHLKHYPEHVEALILAGKCYYALADIYGSNPKDLIEKGIKVYSKLINFFPDNADYYFFRGHLHKRAKKDSEAFDDFESARNHGYSEELAPVILYLWNKIPNPAKSDPTYVKTFTDKYLNQMKTTNKNALQVFYYQIRIFSDAGQERLISDTLNRMDAFNLNEHPSLKRKNFYALAKSHLRQRRFIPCAETLQLVLDKLPNDMKAFAAKCFAQMFAGQSQQVLQDCTRRIETTDPFTPRLEQIYSMRSWAYLRQGLEKDAIRDYLNMLIVYTLRIEPDCIHLLNSINFTHALADFEKKHGNKVFSQELLAAAYMHLENYPKAIDCFRKAIKSGLAFDYPICIAIAYLNSGRYEMAKRILKSIDDRHFDIHLKFYYEAKTCFKQNKWFEANYTLKNIIANESDPALKKICADLSVEIERAQSEHQVTQKVQNHPKPAQVATTKVLTDVDEEEITEVEASIKAIHKERSRGAFFYGLKEDQPQEMSHLHRLETHAHNESMRQKAQEELQSKEWLEAKIRETRQRERELAEKARAEARREREHGMATPPPPLLLRPLKPLPKQSSEPLTPQQQHDLRLLQLQYRPPVEQTKLAAFLQRDPIVNKPSVASEEEKKQLFKDISSQITKLRMIACSPKRDDVDAFQDCINAISKIFDKLKEGRVIIPLSVLTKLRTIPTSPNPADLVEEAHKEFNQYKESYWQMQAMLKNQRH